ncbi:MAG: AtpZ/AtpI family protein [Deltaproteobacteria bacterium]|nr:AtpZ/AtpI family protein [Deltaproteobacteria bacterium]
MIPGDAPSSQNSGHKKPKKMSDRDSLYRAMGLYSGLGIQLVVSVMVGVYAGDWLDKRWQTAPFMLMLGLFLGAGSGFYQLFRVANLMNERKKNSDSEE